jgi:hypothetical protein
MQSSPEKKSQQAQQHSSRDDSKSKSSSKINFKGQIHLDTSEALMADLKIKLLNSPGNGLIF